MLCLAAKSYHFCVHNFKLWMPVSLQHIVALKKQKLCHLQDGFEMFLSTKAEYIQKFFWACLDCQVILTVAKLLKKYSTENMRCYLAFWLTTDRLYVCLLFKTVIHHFHSYPLLLKETRPGSRFYSLENKTKDWPLVHERELLVFWIRSL